jgi:hypothetical protein
MTDRWIDTRTELAASQRTRVEIGEDGVLHVLAGPITLHLDRCACEELTTTLARAMVTLARREPARRAPGLKLVRETQLTGEGAASHAATADAPTEPRSPAAPQ